MKNFLERMWVFFFQRENPCFILQINKTSLYAPLGTGLRMITAGTGAALWNGPPSSDQTEDTYWPASQPFQLISTPLFKLIDHKKREKNE